MQLQSRCYFQLTEDEMPSKASKSIESQLTMLIKAAKGKLVLCVLDGGQYSCVVEPDLAFCASALLALQTCGAENTLSRSIVSTITVRSF